ncbi:hypothetical protein WOLCODRAFT_33646, partial [Wolfiporia cocos MD-104 SS10]
RQNRLYQCSCGMDNAAGNHPSKRGDNPWKDVGCCTWLQLITTYDPKGKRLLAIHEVYGILKHSAACLDQTEMTKSPPIPLHPMIRDYAISLFQKSFTLNLVRTHCRDFAQEKFSHLSGDEILYGDNSYHYILNEHEATSLYHTLNKQLGISQRSAAHTNLGLWFRTDNPRPPSPLLSEACLYYQPHIENVSDRFVIIISTPEQRQLAWKHGHQQLMFLDGTFGFCSARTLLFTPMAFDDLLHGVPLGHILFSACETTKSSGVHADYNSELMHELLGRFRQGLGTNELGESFAPIVGMTDNDTKERYGLSQEWPEILLLLCMFHMWQAWQNGLNKYLRCIPKGPARNEIRKHLAVLLLRLLKEIDVYENAITAFNEEVQHFKSSKFEHNALTRSQAKGALLFLAYLQSYLKSHSFWLSWSLAGAQEAARRLNIPVEQVARTTNPLESFQGRLKNNYFGSYLRSGRLPRLDLWIIILVTKVLPEFFQTRKERRARGEYYQSKRQALP